MAQNLALFDSRERRGHSLDRLKMTYYTQCGRDQALGHNIASLMHAPIRATRLPRCRTDQGKKRCKYMHRPGFPIIPRQCHPARCC